MLKRALPEWTNNKLAVALILMWAPSLLGVLWAVWHVMQIDPALVPTRERYNQVTDHISADEKRHAAEDLRAERQDEALEWIKAMLAREEQRSIRTDERLSRIEARLARLDPRQSSRAIVPARSALAALGAAAPRN